MSLSTKTISGIIWNFCEQLLRRGVQTFTTLLLAFFLEPEAYGLVAMMAVFIAIATSLMDSGFKQALLRLKNTSDADFSTVFYANLLLGLLAYASLYFTAPLIAIFYKETQLILLLRVTGLVVLINSLKVIQETIFSRELNFKIQMQANLPAALISSIIAVLLAFLNYGVWALIVQMLSFAFVSAATLWMLSEWRPRLVFSKQSLLSMYNFGYKLFLSGLLDTVFKNIYIIIIAKLFASTITGLYFFAQKIQEIITSQLVGAIQTVTYPALAKLQQSDEKLKEGYRKIIILTTFIVFPTFTCLAALAEPIFQALLPARWLNSVPYLQWLCVGGMLYPLHTINLNILKVKGRSDLFLYLEVLKKVLVVCILFISVRYGIYGILIGQAINSLIAYIPNSYFTAKLINYSIFEQIKDFMPSMLLSFTVAGLIYIFTITINLSSLVLISILIPLAILLYIFMAYVFKMQAILITVDLIKQKFKFKKTII